MTCHGRSADGNFLLSVWCLSNVLCTACQYTNCFQLVSSLNITWFGITLYCIQHSNTRVITSLIARFMGPTWGPPGSCRPQVGPILAPWTLPSGITKDSQETQHIMVPSHGHVTPQVSYRVSIGRMDHVISEQLHCIWLFMTALIMCYGLFIIPMCHQVALIQCLHTPSNHTANPKGLLSDCWGCETLWHKVDGFTTVTINVIPFIVRLLFLL